MEMKNICGKIPVDLHEKVRLEIEQTDSSTQKFIHMPIMVWVPMSPIVTP